MIRTVFPQQDSNPCCHRGEAEILTITPYGSTGHGFFIGEYLRSEVGTDYAITRFVWVPGSSLAEGVVLAG